VSATWNSTADTGDESTCPSQTTDDDADVDDDDIDDDVSSGGSLELDESAAALDELLAITRNGLIPQSQQPRSLQARPGRSRYRWIALRCWTIARWRHHSSGRAVVSW